MDGGSSVQRHDPSVQSSSLKRTRADPEDGDVAKRPRGETHGGHFHQGAVAQGFARQHNGHNINTYYMNGGLPEHLMPHTPEQVLESLRFDQMEDRYAGVRSALSQTCEWLLESSEYQQWLDQQSIAKHRGFLWIKGKPGAGKSTLMKFACRDVRRRCRDSEHDIAVTFFFNARGRDALESSLEGMYRSLIAQIITRIPRLLGLLSTQRRRARWPAEVLRELFGEIVRRLEGERLTCFIDALDECPADELKSMIEQFIELGDASARENRDFRVLFASRHYPGVSLGSCLELNLDVQQGHQLDITKYIQMHLIVGSAGLKRDLSTRILAKAQSVFLWVVLVVQILTEDIRKGMEENISKRLRELPSDLHRLFEDVILRETKQDASTVPVLLWVLFAKRPLALDELYYAMRFTTEERNCRMKISRPPSVELMARRVRSASRGLVEASGGGTSAMQLIHESVREYLLVAGLDLLDPTLLGNLRGRAHERLRKACYACLTSFGHDALLMVDTGAETGRPKAALDTSYPLLGVSLSNVLHHAEVAQRRGISQLAALQSFDVIKWRDVREKLERWKYELHPGGFTMMYVLAEQGHFALLRELLHSNPPAESRPLETAIEKRRLDIARLLLGHRWDMPTCEYRGMLLELAHSAKDELMMKMCIAGGACGNLSDFCQSGNLAVVELLLDAGASPNDFCLTLQGMMDPVFEACKAGHEQIVALLLERGVDMKRSGDRRGGSLLEISCRYCHWSIYKLLKSHGAIPDGGEPDRYLADPFLREVKSGHTHGVKTLLACGADVNASCGARTALQEACFQGHWDIVAILLDRGADPRRSSKDTPTPVYLAAMKNRADMLERMLDLGAKVDVGVEEVRAKGYTEVLQVLIRHLAKPQVSIPLRSGS